MGERKIVRRGPDRKPRKERTDGVTKERRMRFLAGLAETAHVGRSALLAGKKDPGSFYRLRLRDPVFARQWDEAVATGTARIEAGLMARAVATIEAERAAADAEANGAPLAPLAFDQLMQLLKYYRTAPPGGLKHGPKRRYATCEEIDAALMERLDAIEARLKARRARERAERRAAREAAAAMGEG